MKIGKKTAVTKEITRQERNRKNNIRRLSISAIIAFIIFICLTIIQSSILNQEEKQAVYQVTADIPVGTKITEDNIDQYLGLKQVQVSLIPEGYITSADEMIGKFINRKYKAKDIITVDGLTDTEKLYRDKIDNPIEISFSTGSLSTAVSGTIREGDYINIYGLRKPTDGSAISYTGFSDSMYEVDSQFTFKHVYVTKAFDGNGSRITTPDTDEDIITGDAVTATMFSIIIDEKDAELFSELLKNCEIRLSKLLYTTDTDYQSFLNETNKNAAKLTIGKSTTSEDEVNADYTFDGPSEEEAVQEDEVVEQVESTEQIESQQDTAEQDSQASDAEENQTPSEAEQVVAE